MNNRSVQVTSPYTNQTYTMYHYSVNNTAPRPESYIDGAHLTVIIVEPYDADGHVSQTTLLRLTLPCPP